MLIARERPERAPRQPDRTDVSSWRRETPLELPERRGGGFRGGRGGFDRRGGDTSWRGGAFTRRDDRFGKFFFQLATCIKVIYSFIDTLYMFQVATMLLLNVLVSISSHALLIHHQLLPPKVPRATSPILLVLLSLLILKKHLSVLKTSSKRPLSASEQTADRRRRRKTLLFQLITDSFQHTTFFTTQSNTPNPPYTTYKKKNTEEKKEHNKRIRDVCHLFYLAFSLHHKIQFSSLLEMHKCLICCLQT